MVHNSLESFHSKDGAFSLELAVEYLGLSMIVLIPSNVFWPKSH